MASEAVQNLQTRALEIVDRARCPHCSKRPPRYLAKRFSGFQKTALIYGSLLGGCGVASQVISDASPLLGLGLLFFGSTIAYDLYERLRTGDSRIEWTT